MPRIHSFSLALTQLAVLAATALSGIPVALGSEPLTGAVFGPAVNYSSQGYGDTWVGAWADDGHLYSLVDDTSLGGNLAIVRLRGDDPRRLTIETVNTMSEYGKENQLFGPERLCWKGNSLLCVDGVLYATISRHDYPWANPKLTDKKQTSQHGSIIKSLDHGKTWTRSMQENMARPMFPGRPFATGFFIQYGKNASVKAHGSDRFVYAISNDGYWNNGNSLILGRVPRNKLSRLNGADWEFYRGGDGMQDAAWTRDVHRAALLLDDPDKVGMSAAAYIPQRGRYVLFQWHYEKNRFGGPSTWVLRESPTPWGPWTPIATAAYPAERYYSPCLMAKFIEDDGLRFWIATGGEWTDVPRLYSLKAMPVTVWTNASLALSANDLQFAAAAGTPDPPARTIDVQLGKTTPKDVQVTVPGRPAWLTVTSESHGDRLRLINRVRTAGLAVGSYDADVILTSPSADPSTTRYQVHLEKRGQEHILE